MNKIKTFLLLLAAAVVLPLAAQQMPPMPVDSAVRIGKLANGLTYYIRANQLPENRVNFYIAQKVGSVQEEDSQRGLAHFLEHMCFNGTEHFPDDALVKYCERIGVKFGQNLNAYTSTDETVYNIDGVPVSESNIDSCLLILHDWSCGLTLATPEIDKERGVIHEEWRMRSSATMRIYERNLPALYPGSRYGYRFPIGTMEVIDNFKPEELRAYYHKWYRPDLQGIIVVGDIDVDKMEQKIKALFSPIPMPENPAAYELYPVPSTPEPIYIVDRDKEQQSGMIMLSYKHEALPREQRGGMAKLVFNLLTDVMSNVLNARLDELSKKEDCPFIGAGSGDGNYLISKTMGAFSIGIMPKPGKSVEALKAVITEVKRAAVHGFTDTEVIRAREEMKSRYEKLYNNRDKQESDYYIPQYVRHFLEGDAIPDIATEYKLATMLLQQLPALAYSETFGEMVASTDSNFVCLAMYPESQPQPRAEELRAAVTEAMAAQVEPYVDNVKNEPLVPVLPAPVKVKSESPAAHGYTCWTLKNGARVFYRRTDFDNSQVLFHAASFGGSNALPERDNLAIKLFNGVIGSTGLGNFTATELEKALAGKQVSLAVNLDEQTESLSGNATPKDLRTLFELIHLRFQAPANDPEGYRSFITATRTQLENIDKVPEAAFSDSVVSTVYPGNARRARLTAADLDGADYDAVRRIYSERFASAGDFDFYFTGAFDVDSLRAFTEQYIAPLKGVKKREKVTDLPVNYPAKGDRNNRFTREMETPKAMTVQVWWGEQPYSLRTAVTADALGQILSQRYLKSIREEGSMAYSVGAQALASYGTRDLYQLQIYCPVKPEKLDSALILMEQGIMDIARDGVTAEELGKVKEFELKDFADKQKKNSYWQNLISVQTAWNQDLRADKENLIRNLKSDDIRTFVKNVLLRDHNRCIISMLPAAMKE